MQAAETISESGHNNTSVQASSDASPQPMRLCFAERTSTKSMLWDSNRVEGWWTHYKRCMYVLYDCMSVCAYVPYVCMYTGKHSFSALHILLLGASLHLRGLPISAASSYPLHPMLPARQLGQERSFGPFFAQFRGLDCFQTWFMGSHGRESSHDFSMRFKKPMQPMYNGPCQYGFMNIW